MRRRTNVRRLSYKISPALYSAGLLPFYFSETSVMLL